MKKILSIIFMAILLTGCFQNPKQAEQSVPETAKPTEEQIVEADSLLEAEENESNLFDARKIKVGDEVAGLKVVNIEVGNGEEEDYDAYVNFEGEVTVSGTFKHNLNDEFLENEISFVVDKESAAKLPKLAHDQRYVWFTFMNHDEAEKEFGDPGTEGKATVTIKNYSINYAHTEIWNTAELIKADISSK